MWFATVNFEIKNAKSSNPAYYSALKDSLRLLLQAILHDDQADAGIRPPPHPGKKRGEMPV